MNSVNKPGKESTAKLKTHKLGVTRTTALDGVIVFLKDENGIESVLITKDLKIFDLYRHEDGESLKAVPREL